MISKKLFEQLSIICSLKNDSYSFGNIQLVFCGDFLQLPPVKNILYNEDGQFCFMSPIFDKVFRHKIFLKEIKRQQDAVFIKTINQVSLGQMSEEINEYIKTFERPLHSVYGDDRKNSVKLFATNELVDMYNRKCILDLHGELFEYRANDTGDVSKLRKILAPPVLWLKRNCQVILLRNISKKLVNGLIGQVIACEQDGPVVYFPQIAVSTKLQKIPFSVYNPALKRNVAERIQIPIKLGFAMTIHKSQGMTLDSVEIDCQQIFLPGQLGVAIGRCKSPDGLRIINFKEEICMPHPSEVETFINQEVSFPVLADQQCCRNVLREDLESALHENFTIDDVLNETADEEKEEVFDEEFNTIISFVSDDGLEENIVLPENFEIETVLLELIFKNPLTQMQKDVNEVLSLLTTNNLYNVKQFCSHEFSIITDLLEILKIDNNDPKPVKPEYFSNFYSKCHEYQTSTSYKARALLMADGIKTATPKVISHIAFKLTAAARKYLLQEKEQLYPVGSRVMEKREITGHGSLGKVRYVSGYCLAKVRYKYTKIKFSNCYKTSSEDQKRYNEACIVTKILESMRVSEKGIQLTSQYPETLLETAQKQNISHGLTNISDDLYSFFVSVCEVCLEEMVDKNLNIYGSNMYNICVEKLVKSTDLYRKFSYCATVSYTQDFSEGNDIDTIAADMVEKVCAIEQIYVDLVTKFALVMFNQYRKDLLQMLSVEKKMAHRKQIRVSKAAKHVPVTNVNFNFIVNDTSIGRSVSHHILKRMILKDMKFLHKFKKTELVVLCKAYDVPQKSSENKDSLVKKLNSEIIKSGDEIPNQEFFKPTPGDSTCDKQASEFPMEQAPSTSELPMEQAPSTSELPMEQAPSTSELHMEQAPSTSELPMEQAPSTSELHMEQAPSTSELPMEQAPSTSELHMEQAPSTSELPMEQAPSTSELHMEQAPSTSELHMEQATSTSEPYKEPAPNTDEEMLISVTCKKCHKPEREGENWIQCETCNEWLHRKCAGLSNNFKWKRFCRKNVHFSCESCK